MITWLEGWWRGALRWTSRSEWAIRLLRLTVTRDAAMQSGLILVQIDGLSRAQLHKALERDRMPFLRRLMLAEGYQEHPLFAGVPASTPVVQAELFYGVKGAVPAFSYFDRQEQRVFKMYNPHDAAAVEERLKTQGTPLLEGGSAYVDIFTGGAAEPHFCAAALGWGSWLRGARWLAMPLLIVLHLHIVVRLAVLLVVETVLSVIDVVRGVLSGKTFLEEFLFIFTRLGICIMLRDLVVIGAKIDIARGLPIIHVNFIGYDEQSHRRGPSSAFAHWTLRGIDGAIGRLWQAAHRSKRRSYDLWMYSDHGQEDTISYPVKYKMSVEQAIAEVFTTLIGPVKVPAQERHGVQTKRVMFLGGHWLQRLLQFQRHVGGAGAPQPHELIVTSMGSLGHVYPPEPLTPEQLRRLAAALVADANIPLVLRPLEDGRAEAWTVGGMVLLPDEAPRVFGADHPYLAEVTEEMLLMCHHPDAGALSISGWSKDQPVVSFPVEHGSHTGPGREETNGFALLPVDAPLPSRLRPYVRAWDLREAVNRHLGRAVVELSREARPGTAPVPTTLRVMTYNTHSCLGMDGRVSPTRIARLIARHRPDAVALQEIDVGRFRTGRVDQAEIIARRLDMTFHFHAAVQLEGEHFGNTILSRYPMRVTRAAALPRLSPRIYYQPRSALWVTLNVNGVPVQLINCHLSLWPRERVIQVDDLLGASWLRHADCAGLIVLCGDFNSLPGSTVYRRLGGPLQDAQRVLRAHRPLGTWFGRYAWGRLDHVFVSPGVEVVSIEVPSSELAKVSSDHLPLIVELRMPTPSATMPEASGAVTAPSA